MKELTREQLYQAVGEVVGASQIFEVAFLLFAKLALKNRFVGSLEEVQPVSKSSFKQPSKSVLKELAEIVQLDPVFLNRVEKLIENRHEIVHRQFLTDGWPRPLSPERSERFYQLCRDTVLESKTLTIELLALLVEWLDRFPKSKDFAAKHKEMLEKIVGDMSGVKWPILA